MKKKCLSDKMILQTINNIYIQWYVKPTYLIYSISSLNWYIQFIVNDINTMIFEWQSYKR